jgi:hypothetical protein
LQVKKRRIPPALPERGVRRVNRDPLFGRRVTRE